MDAKQELYAGADYQKVKINDIEEVGEDRFEINTEKGEFTAERIFSGQWVANQTGYHEKADIFNDIRQMFHDFKRFS